MRYCLFAFICLVLFACQSHPPQDAASDVADEFVSDQGQSDQSKPWPDFVDQFIEFHLAANPVSAVSQGRHEFDGQLPDFSPEGIDAYVTALRDFRQRAAAFGDNQLTAAQRFERDYLLAEVDEEIFWLVDVRIQHKSPLWYGYGLSPDLYISREYAPIEQRMVAVTRYARNLPRALAQMRSNLGGPLPRTYVETAEKIFAGLGSFLATTVPDYFANAGSPTQRDDLNTALEGARDALAGTVTWLEAKRETMTEDFALGPENYRKMLQVTEGVTTPLDELERIGEADLERNLAALEQACQQVAPDQSLSDCMAQVEANKAPEGPVAGALRQLDGLREFVLDQQIVTIPSDEKAEVDEAPPHRRFNLAYISIPGPYEKNLPAVYYIAPPDPDWSEAQRQDYVPGEKNLLYVSVHEVWPGHFLNFLHAKRADSLFGRLFVGYAFAEGWAHYTEEMMWDEGLDAGEAESHIGQLSNALLRNVRYLCSIGLHTQGMSVDECRQMFVEKGMQDEGNAVQQAYRGTFDPGYLNYTMGKLMIMQLRKDWMAANPQASLKDFHDEFLSYGGPPIPMVRRAMLGHEAGGDLIAVPE